MNSPKKLNYEIRPCKYAERKMLLASFARIISRMGFEYQYIGFGGLSFTDFKLFHKELEINHMFSIEGGDFSLDRINTNIPFSCIQIMQGMSTEMLRNLDLTKPSLIWLDYDDVLSMTVFEDINIIFNSIPVGSVFVLSCNRQLRNKENNPYTPEELRQQFGTLTPFDLKENSCSDTNSSTTIRQMVEFYCTRIIKDRNNLGERIKFQPLYNIEYEEHRGARMYTFGGIILRDDENIDNLNIKDYAFINTEQPYEIKIPNITHRESLVINQVLGDVVKEKELIEKGIITVENLKHYKKIYKFMPNFYDVRL